MEKELVEILMPVALAAISALASIATYALKIVADKAKAHTAAIKDETARSIAYSLLSDAQDAIETAVLETNQTMVSGLKAASADGKLTDKEMAAALRKSYSKAKALLGEEAIKELKKILPDVEMWIMANIEATIAKRK